jgi:hypothetical protein
MRGESILYGSHPIKKKKDELLKTPLPRKDLARDSQTLGLEEWMAADGWIGGHYWIARAEELPSDWEKGKKIDPPSDFLALIARAKAHLGSLGKSERVYFSDDFGGSERAEPMRDILHENDKHLAYVNSDYLEAGLRLLKEEPERWHMVDLNGRSMLIGYKREDPLLVIAPAR